MNELHDPAEFRTRLRGWLDANDLTLSLIHI